MNYTFENIAVQSFYLWLNNRIQSNGGCINYSSQLFPINQTINGLYTYAAPFCQFVSDNSISGINIISGVYVNNSFITPGQSGLVDINYDKGQVYFNQPINGTVSGNYAIREINTVIPWFPDMNLLFETKMTLRPKQPQVYTGVANNTISYPAIFVKPEGGKNTPWEFGGTDRSFITMNCYVFCENQFQLDAINSILKDSRLKYIPIISATESPYNVYGGYKNGIPYNYQNLTQNKVLAGSGIIIEEVTVTDWGRRGIASTLESMTNDSFFSLISCSIWAPRVPV